MLNLSYNVSGYQELNKVVIYENSSTCPLVSSNRKVIKQEIFFTVEPTIVAERFARKELNPFHFKECPKALQEV